jgi:hypothetical protein
MINKKSILSIFTLILLNSCAQSTAMLGPVYTLGSTGNVYQTGLSMGSSLGSSSMVTKMTGKTPTENMKMILKTNQNKKIDRDLYILVENNIKKTSKILQIKE